MNSTTYALALAVTQFLSACTHSADVSLNGAVPREFVGTTPCAALAREFLQIPTTQLCDKITWRLVLSQLNTTNSYKLVATFGLQEQSAPGYIAGGTTVVLEGKFNILPGPKSRPIYEITSGKSERSLCFVWLNDNLLHLLDRDKNLLIGNEFWSYTLNREGVGRDH